MHAFRPFAIVLLVVWISCCSCASFDDPKKWGETLSLGGGLVDEAEKEIETALSLAPPSSSRPFLPESRPSQAAAKFTEGQLSSDEQQSRYWEAQLERAEFNAEIIFSKEGLLSGDARKHWVPRVVFGNRKTRTYVFSPEEQVFLLDYIKTRMLAQMDTAKKHSNLVSRIHFTVDQADPGMKGWRDAYYIDSGVKDVVPASRWTTLNSKEERIFNLGALRFRMTQAMEQPIYVQGTGHVGTWNVVARPLEEGDKKWRAFVGRLNIPTAIYQKLSSTSEERKKASMSLN